MTRRPNEQRRARGGFTLVEMLVAVALTLVIMSMFASVFQIAAVTMRRHRGAAENDQSARSIFTMLQGDLQKRTYRQREDAIKLPIFISGDLMVLDDNPLNWTEEQRETVLSNTANRNALGIVPLHPAYIIGSALRDVDSQERGYFYISENDPFNDADDVLQFTVELEPSEDDLYIGRARPLGPGDPDPPRPTIFTWNHNTDAAVNTNQPIWDDGVGFKQDTLDADGDGRTDDVISYAGEDTGTSASRSAEVSLFVRNGNLIRRVLLIREGGQPTKSFPGPTVDYVTGNYRPGIEDVTPTAINTSDFWNDFDSSATRRDPPEVPTPFVRFNSVDDLNNMTAGPDALGNPRNRFGHDSSPRISGGDALQGRPKEYLFPSNAALVQFIGRYTHEETSHPRFEYPGVVTAPAPPHPYTPMSADVEDLNGAVPLPAGLRFADENGNGKVDRFEDGPRRGEDILMTNVHSFDVKVWDAALGDWADIGHQLVNPNTGARGDWHLSRVFGIPPAEQWRPFDPGDLTDPDDAPSTVRPFQSARRQMYRYGSLDASLALAGTAFNRVFDTWHPQFNFDTANDNGTANEDPLDDVPPFRPLWTDRDTFDVESNMAGSPRALPVVWEPNHAYEFPYPRDDPSAFDDPSRSPCRVFPQPRLRDVNEYYPGHQSMFYQVVEVQDLDGDGIYRSAALLPGSQPAWPAVAGEEVQDGEIRWRAYNNTIGLPSVCRNSRLSPV